LPHESYEKWELVPAKAEIEQKEKDLDKSQLIHDYD